MRTAKTLIRLGGLLILSCHGSIFSVPGHCVLSPILLTAQVKITSLMIIHFLRIEVNTVN